MKALTISPRRSKPCVILTGPCYGAQLQTLSPSRRRFSWRKALRSLWRITFCEKVNIAVAIVVICAMWWHNISIVDTIEAQKAVGTDCLLGMPWALVWAVRATSNSRRERGCADELAQ